MRNWDILFLSVIFLITEDIHADLTTRSPACQELEEKGLMVIEEKPVRDEVPLSCAEPVIVAGDIATMQGTVRDLESHLMKHRIFEALKEEAIADQILNQFEAWEHLGYGKDQKWAERENHVCVSRNRYPEAHRRMNDLNPVSKQSIQRPFARSI